VRGYLASVSDLGYHAALIAGMYAAMATEPEVAAYVRLVERGTDAAAESDIPFAGELLRIVLRLDEVAGRSSV
jgi:hypothetical protein